MSLAYLDTSAYVKTMVAEPESKRLRAWLEQWPERASCSLLRTEAVRAVRRHGAGAIALARAGFSTLELVRLDHELLDAAADLVPELRTLDVIHVAAAMSLGADLGALVTYDERMISAAQQLHLPVVTP